MLSLPTNPTKVDLIKFVHVSSYNLRGSTGVKMWTVNHVFELTPRKQEKEHRRIEDLTVRSKERITRVSYKDFLVSFINFHRTPNPEPWSVNVLTMNCNQSRSVFQLGSSFPPFSGI